MANPTVLENAFVAFTTATGSAVYTELAGVKSVTLPISRAQLDDSVMGDTIGAKYPGRLEIPIDILCRQDFTTTLSAAGGVDKLTYTRLINRTAARLKIRPVDTTVGGTNPSYILSRVFITDTTPIDGKHGDALENKIKVVVGSGCTLTRSTAT
jgi:hypothetical protein